MGLDTTHDCWHGSYGNFTRWRDVLAEAAGYELVEVKQDWMISNRIKGLNYDIPEERYMGRGWKKEIPAVEGHDPDPMLLLILHSDCDGVIKPKHLKPIADRLCELLPKIDDEYMADRTRRFIAGLREAHDAGEQVMFG